MATAHVFLWLWPLSCEGIQISQKSWACILCLPPGPCSEVIGLVGVTNQGHGSSTMTLGQPMSCSLKKEWQAWIKLMDTSKGVTGIGFDRETWLFTASEEWWDNLKSTNKIAYKFKTKSLEHEDLIREVFTGATATGKHHWTPGEKAVDVGEGKSDSVDSPGLAPFTEPYRLVGNSPPNSPTVHLDEADPGTKRKKGGNTSGKSKKVSTGASVLVNSFNHLSKAIETQKHLTVRHGTGASQKYGLEPCIQWLMAIPNFISTPLFHFACTALENVDYREILMRMPDDENVVGWLQALQVSKGL